VNEQDYITL